MTAHTPDLPTLRLRLDSATRTKTRAKIRAQIQRAESRSAVARKRR